MQYKLIVLASVLAQANAWTHTVGDKCYSSVAYCVEGSPIILRCGGSGTLYAGNCADNLNEPVLGALCVQSNDASGDAWCSAITPVESATTSLSSVKIATSTTESQLTNSAPNTPQTSLAISIDVPAGQSAGYGDVDSVSTPAETSTSLSNAPAGLSAVYIPTTTVASISDDTPPSGPPAGQPGAMTYSPSVYASSAPFPPSTPETAAISTSCPTSTASGGSSDSLIDTLGNYAAPITTADSNGYIPSGAINYPSVSPSTNSANVPASPNYSSAPSIPNPVNDKNSAGNSSPGASYPGVASSANLGLGNTSSTNSGLGNTGYGDSGIDNTGNGNNGVGNAGNGNLGQGCSYKNCVVSPEVYGGPSESGTSASDVSDGASYGPNSSPSGTLSESGSSLPPVSPYQGTANTKTVGIFNVVTACLIVVFVSF